MSRLVVALALFSTLSASVVQADKENDGSNSYACSSCVRILSRAARAEATFAELCEETIAKKGCSLLFGHKAAALAHPRPAAQDDFCFEHGFCPVPSAAWLDSIAAASAAHASASTNTPSIRVSKAVGSAAAGYYAARVSLVSTAPITATDFPLPNAYIAPFKYKWTQFNLATALVEVSATGSSTFTIAGQPVTLRLPAENAPVRGLVISDPCITSEWVGCKYQTQWDTFGKLTGLINAAAEHGDLDYWQLLGDNFYDQQGNATAAFFDALSLQAKTTVLLSCPGNHDTWVSGDPSAYTSSDQLQNGFFQFYGQDVVAATQSNYSTPYDFSVDPTKEGATARTLPPASNLFTYSKLGNVVFIGFSGAHDFASQKTYFEEACTFATASSAAVVLLEGHWNIDGDGCTDGAVPEVYGSIGTLPACAAVKDRMRYLMGHQHCNKVVERGAGFMVGGAGMSGCGQFGVTVLDSSPPSASASAGAAGAGAGAATPLSVYHFRINSDDGLDYYNQTAACFREKGVGGCYGLDNVDVWELAAL